MTDRQRLTEQLIRHEGLRLKPYTDTAGKLTIGVGRNLTDVGLSSAEVFTLLEHDIDAAMHGCAAFPWFSGLSPVRQRVIVDMFFNLGASRFRLFVRMIRALAIGNFDLAASEMLASEWAKQVGVRAIDLARMMRTNEDHLLT